MSKTLTYLGPVEVEDEELQPSDAYRIPQEGKPDLVFPVGREVEDVPDALVRQLLKVEGHKFTTDTVQESVPPWADYDELTAEEVVERIGDPIQTPTADFASRVVSYEKAHEKRKTVTEAAQGQADAYAPGSEQAESTPSVKS